MSLLRKILLTFFLLFPISNSFAAVVTEVRDTDVAGGDSNTVNGIEFNKEGTNRQNHVQLETGLYSNVAYHSEGGGGSWKILPKMRSRFLRFYNILDALTKLEMRFARGRTQRVAAELMLLLSSPELRVA